MSDSAEQQIDALLAVNRHQDAMRLIHSALTARPGDPDLLCRLSQSLLGLRKPAEALDAARQAAAAAPEHEWPHRLMSVALLNLKRPGDAVAAAAESVRRAPSEPMPFLAHANALLAADRTDEASASAEELRTLAPTWPDAWNVLGRVALRRRDWKAGEAWFRKALELDPGNAVAINNLGVALQRQGRRGEAATLYRSAASSDPTLDVARRNVFSSTRYQLIAGLAFLFVAIRTIALLGRSSVDSRLLLAIVAVGLVAIAGIYWYRWSRLDPALRLAYRAELRRTRRARYGSMAFVAGLVVLLAAAVVLALALDGLGYGAVAVAVAFVAVVAAGAAFFTRRRILARLGI